VASPGDPLRQRDSVSCGPCVAVVAGTLLDPAYSAAVGEAGARFDAEQRRIHQSINRIWPRRLGMTPAGMARALSRYRPYRWRIFRGRRDRLEDVRTAATNGQPVPMLIGNLIPRHWVLVIDVVGDDVACYEPSSGTIRICDIGDLRDSRLDGLGFPRPFGFVVPD
jgi:hypothetical protein